MFIRLSDGSKIDFKNLDKLENAQIKNKLLSLFDKKDANGVSDSVLSKEEINEIKNFLKTVAGKDNTITRAELASYQKNNPSIFNKNSTKTDDMYAELAKLSDKNKDDVFVVKSGDTVDSIVKELGFEGEDAKKYKKAFIAQLKEDGSFMNDKNWLMAGSKIHLLNNEVLNELGIKKKTTKVIENNENNNENIHKVETGETVSKIVAKLGYTGEDAKIYTREFIKQLQADGSFINDKKWLRAGSDIRLLSDAKVAELGLPKGNVKALCGGRATSDLELTTSKITPELILNKLKMQNQKASVVEASQLSQEHQEYVNKYGTFLGVEPVIIKNETTGDIHVLYDTKDSEFGQNSGLTTMETVLSDECIQTTRYYSNNKIARDYEYSNIENNKSELLQAPIKTDKKETKIMSAVPLDIEIDEELFEGLTQIQKENLLAFKKTLIAEKANLMADLNMDNDTYNRYAKLALCIAMQESDFGDSRRYNFENKIGNRVEDTIARFNRNRGMNIGGSTSASVGLTQIKIRDKYDDPMLKPILEKYNVDITHPTAEQSAVATIAVLARMEKICSLRHIVSGVEAAQGRIYDRVTNDGEYLILDSGVKENIITEDDVLMYVYNGSPGQLKKGLATPASRNYTKNIEEYKKYFTLTEDEALRAEAIKNNSTKMISSSVNRKSMQADLSYGIGQISFGGNLYKAGISKNTPEELKMIRSVVIAKNFDPKLSEQFLAKLSKGEITFAYGATEQEIYSLSQDDMKLMLEYSDNLNKQIANISDNKQKISIASQIDKDFKEAFLNSHARRYDRDDVEESSVVELVDDYTNIQRYPKGGYGTDAHERVISLKPQLIGNKTQNAGYYSTEKALENQKYRGFMAQKSIGHNMDNAREIDTLLAKNALDVSHTLATSGQCLTGTKQALYGVGAIEKEEMRTFNQAFQLATFCEQHPERFQEIKYVDLGDGQVREITATDIGKLPAGYIVVYGNKARTDVPGHAGITDGNGGINSDEGDNANWDNFASGYKNQNGKGEHGYVRIFKLNESYEIYTMKLNSYGDGGTS